MKELWINLPVKDVAKSREFFREIGFAIHPKHEDDPHMCGFFVGERGTIIMLFPEQDFSSFNGNHPVTNAAESSEVLLSFNGESRQEVDDMAQRVTAAGGKVFAAPSLQDGWLYGMGFTDLDGHRWNMLFMDVAAQE